MNFAKYESNKYSYIERTPKFKEGDRVITDNQKYGTVVRTEVDELGEYFVVQLDKLAGEYAYDSWDLKKVH